MAIRTGDETLYVTEKAGPDPRDPQRRARRRAGPRLQLDGRTARATSRASSGSTFSPDGSKLYVHYSNDGGDTRVDEYAVDAAGAVDAASRREVLAQDQPQSNHNGGELAFGPDGHALPRARRRRRRGRPGLRARVGRQRAVARTPGSARSCASTRRRAAADAYTVPPDNPFVGTAGARPEIWAYGLRNPWRFSWDTDDRRPLDRRRRPERVGRGRPRDQGLRRRARASTTAGTSARARTASATVTRPARSHRSSSTRTTAGTAR